jgi:hypothetical protein
LEASDGPAVCRVEISEGSRDALLIVGGVRRQFYNNAWGNAADTAPSRCSERTSQECESFSDEQREAPKRRLLRIFFVVVRRARQRKHSPGTPKQEKWGLVEPRISITVNYR